MLGGCAALGAQGTSSFERLTFVVSVSLQFAHCVSGAAVEIDSSALLATGERTRALPSPVAAKGDELKSVHLQAFATPSKACRLQRPRLGYRAEPISQPDLTTILLHIA